MLRCIFSLLLITSCSYKVIKSGGENQFAYGLEKNYSSQELKDISPSIVTHSKRDPQTGTFDQVFYHGQKPIKRIGIILFESIIQPSRGGLSDSDLVYLSAQGKQLLTEKLLTIWEESFPILNPEMDFIKVSSIKKTSSFNAYGLDEKDHILTKRTGLENDDIFYIGGGKEVTSTTLVGPRGMRDLSMILVPGSELLLGPKFSEHQKHLINDLTKELKLDGVMVVFSEISWTRAQTKKNSGEHIPEEMKMRVAASTLISFTEYHKRMQKIGKGSVNLPKINVPYGTYEVELKIPVVLDVDEKDRNFQTIEKNILNPMLKSYKDISQMIMIRMGEDLRKTF